MIEDEIGVACDICSAHRRVAAKLTQMNGDSEVVYIDREMASVIVIPELVKQAGPRTQKQCRINPTVIIQGTDQEVLLQIPVGCEIFVHDGGMGHIEIWTFHTRIHHEVIWNRDGPPTKKKKLGHKDSRGSKDIRKMFQTPNSPCTQKTTLYDSINKGNRPRLDGRQGRHGKRPPPDTVTNVIEQYPIPSSQSMEMEETVQYLVDRAYVYELTGETFLVEQVYYEEDIDQIVGFGRALNRRWRSGDDEHTLVYGPGGLIDRTDQWSAREDADQHAEKRQRGNGNDSDRENDDNNSRLDIHISSTTSIAIGKSKPSKKPNKTHREDDKMP
jgi:hypothetical protein